MAETRTQKQVDIQFIIGLLVRRRYFILIPLAAAFGISVIISLVLPRQYEAYAMIMVKNKRIVDPLVKDLAVSPDVRQEMSTLSKQVLSWNCLNELVTAAHLADTITEPLKREEFIQWLKKRITVELRGEELIQISYRDRVPAKAQEVVNLLTQSFINEHARMKRMEAETAINFISEQLKIYRNKLESSQKNFSASKIDADLRLAYNKKTLLKDRIAKLQRFIPSQVTTEQNPMIAQLQSQLGKYESELARLTIDAKEGNPRVQELQQLSDEIKRKVEKESQKETVKESVSVTSPSYLQTDQELKQVEMEINYLLKRKRELEHTPTVYRKQVTEEELATLDRNKQADEDIYQLLLKQLEVAYVSERLQDTEKGSRFAIIEYARLPLSPVKPGKKKIVFVGMLFGCFVSAGLIGLMEYVDKSFKTVDEAHDGLPFAFLGAVSKLLLDDLQKPKSLLRRIDDKVLNYFRDNKLFTPWKPIAPYHVKQQPNSSIAPNIISFHEPHSKIAEEFRVIRTNLSLVHCVHITSPVILVTSSCLGEGKSTIAVNLAAGYAMSGKKTALIDADLRRGMVHKLMGTKQTPGLSDMLKGNAVITPSVFPNSLKKLSVIPCGNLVRNPSELLDAQLLNPFIEQFKKQYDIIIIDTPPVINLPDTNIIAPQVDGIVMVVQMERTQKEHVLSAYHSLQQVGGKVMGYVLTNTRYYMPRYLYGYYYGDINA